MATRRSEKTGPQARLDRTPTKGRASSNQINEARGIQTAETGAGVAKRNATHEKTETPHPRKARKVDHKGRIPTRKGLAPLANVLRHKAKSKTRKKNKDTKRTDLKPNRTRAKTHQKDPRQLDLFKNDDAEPTHRQQASKTSEPRKTTGICRKEEESRIQKTLRIRAPARRGKNKALHRPIERTTRQRPMSYFKRAFAAYLGWMTAKAVLFITVILLLLILGIINQ